MPPVSGEGRCKSRLPDILATMDKSDPEISTAWADEAKDRLAAYRRGDLAAVDETAVFVDLDQPEYWRECQNDLK